MALEFLKILGVLFGFSLMAYLIGSLFPQKLLLPERCKNLQKILLGLATTIIFFRIPFRFDLPYSFISLIFFIFLCFSLFKFVFNFFTQKKLNSKSFKININIIIISIVATILPLFPLLYSGAYFFENIGPDLDGHLMSASLFFDGVTHADLLSNLKQATGTTHWWDLKESWSFPDFRIAVGIEFLTRSMRYGHAILATLIAKIFNQDIPFGMLCLLIFSQILFTLVIYDYLRNKKFKEIEVVCITLIIILSQSYIIMIYEGIIAQFLSSALMVFLLFNFGYFFKKEFTILNSLFFAILVSSLMTFFGEGLLIICAYALFYFLINFCEWFVVKNYLHTNVSIKKCISSIFFFIIFLFLIDPAISLEFFEWLKFRLNQNFSGGVGNDSWNLLSLIFSFPYAYLVGVESKWQLLYKNTQLELLSILTLVLFATIFFLYFVKSVKLREPLIFIFVSLTVLLITVLTENKYALWKCAIILQPLILISFYQLFPNFIFLFKKTYLLVIYSILVLFGFIILLSQYSHFSKKIFKEDFSFTKGYITNSNFTLVTPTMSGMYLKLASSGSLYWANSGWGPNFSLNNAKNFPLALYYSCNAEGYKRCIEIRDKNPFDLAPSSLLVLDINTSTILNDNGSINSTLLKKFIESSYAIKNND